MTKFFLLLTLTSAPSFAAPYSTSAIVTNQIFPQFLSETTSAEDESCPISEMVCTKTPGNHGHLPSVECHCGPHRGYGR